jgi:F0F1-type ATP synthase assembly protein I
VTGEEARVKARLRRVLHRIFTPPKTAKWDQVRGEGVVHGLEIVIPTVLFTLLGWWLDSALGTAPLFVIVGFFLGAAGTFASQYYRYKARSEALDAGRPWSRSRDRA